MLALASVGLGGGALAWTFSGGPAAASGADTPLPPGWELCVLEGLAAPATPANIADLDEWQAAEGGSTNNTAAYNPFNSLRTTDVTGAPIPGVDTSNNFPAFSTWAAGCSATVATLFQPNMWVITAALRAGNVTPASAFLAVVDQSAWCAVSPAGVPCYVNEVLSGTDTLPASLPVSSALNVYGNVKSDLQGYQQSIEAVSTDQNEIGIRDLALAAADSNVATARSQLGAASRSLQRFAVGEYVSSGLYSGAPLVSNGGSQQLAVSQPQDSDGVVAQQYLGVTATNLLAKEGAANGVFKDAQQRRDAASKALAQAAVTLTSDQAAENQDLTLLIKDVGTLEHAGACATVTITPPPTSGTDATDVEHHHHDDHGPFDHHDGSAEHDHDDRSANDNDDHDAGSHHHPAERADADSLGTDHDDRAADDDHDDRAGDHDDNHGTAGHSAVNDDNRTAHGGGRCWGAAGLHRFVRSGNQRLTAPDAGKAVLPSPSQPFRFS